MQKQAFDGKFLGDIAVRIAGNGNAVVLHIDICLLYI